MIFKVANSRVIYTAHDVDMVEARDRGTPDATHRITGGYLGECYGVMTPSGRSKGATVTVPEMGRTKGVRMTFTGTDQPLDGYLIGDQA